MKSKLVTLSMVLLAPLLATAADRSLEFEVFLGDKPVGTHRFDIQGFADGTSTVRSVAAFDVKILGIRAYRYRHEATERWAKGCLVQIDASTDDNGRHLQVQGGLLSGHFQLTQPTTSRAGEDCVISYAYWDPERLLHQRVLLNPQTGQIDAVQIEALDEESIVSNGARVRADRFRLRSDKFIIDLWYSKSGQWLQLDSTTSSKRKLHYRLTGIGQPGVKPE